MNKRLHSVSAGVFHLLRDMAVNVQSERCGGVSEIFLHRFYIVAALDRNNRVCMSEIMKAGIGKAYLFHDTLEAVVNRSVREVSPPLDL